MNPVIQDSQASTLSNDEILRYSRHLIMPEVGMEGQQKLKASRVLCIGAGGLGSPIIAGLVQFNTAYVIEGALPAALLAILLDQLLANVEKSFAHSPAEVKT